MPDNPFEPMIKNIGNYVSGTLYAQGVIPPIGIDNYEGLALASQADTHLLAAKDPVIDEIAVGMTGNLISGKTVSGVPPLQLPNSAGYPMQYWNVTLSPYQEGTGDPSPDNVRPIHGTNKLNLFVADSYDPTATPTAVIDMPAQGKNILNIDASNHNAWAFVNIPNNLQPDTEYTFSINGTTSYSYALYLGNYNQSTRALTQAITSGESFTFTTPSSMSNEPLMAVAGSVSGAGNESLSNILPQVELGSSASSYEPFTNTVYTGTIGSEGGESRWGEVDLGTLSWTKENNHFYSSIMSSSAKPSSGAMPNIICSKYIPASYATVIADSTNNTIGLSTTPRIYIYDTAYSDAADFKASLSGVQLVYELVTPTTFAVPSVTIPTPTGTATTWATAEDGTVDSMDVGYIENA